MSVEENATVLIVNPALEERLADIPYRKPLIKQVLESYMAGSRQGTKAQKNRAMVTASTRKLYRQKKTGRSRAGDAASPLRRGGGRAFAAVPRDHSVKVNRRMYAGAMASILGQAHRDERLKTIDVIKLEEPKTRIFYKILCNIAEYRQDKHTLIIQEELDTNLVLSARNLPNVHVTTPQRVSPYQLVGSALILATGESLNRILHSSSKKQS